MLEHLFRRRPQRLQSPAVDIEPEPSALGLVYAISIGERASSFDVLPPVSNHVTDNPWINFDSVTMERCLEEYIKNDNFPIPRTCDREGYQGERHYDYWLSGLRDYLSIKQIAAEYGMILDCSSTVFDFGCASGRALRHFLCHEPSIEIWGGDVNVRHIDWILQFLGSSPRVFHNSALPNFWTLDKSF
jgi:hypothetical protein